MALTRISGNVKGLPKKCAQQRRKDISAQHPSDAGGGDKVKAEQRGKADEHARRDSLCNPLGAVRKATQPVPDIATSALPAPRPGRPGSSATEEKSEGCVV